MDKVNFIKTSDKMTASLLEQQGFTLINKDDNGIFTFLNNSKITFDVDHKNIVYTNMMNV